MRRWFERLCFAPSGLSVALALHSAALAITAIFLFRQFFQDDAYISMRYAENLLAGNGLVWNPGERVEGYTNFLFVIALAALGMLGVDLAPAARVLGVLAYFGLLFVLLRVLSKGTPGDEVRIHRDDALLVLLPLGVVLTSLPLASWSLGGLETLPFALLTTSAVAAVSILLSPGGAPGITPGIRAGFLFALATLMRPEGGFFFLVTFGYLTLLFMRRLEFPRQMAKGVRLLAIFGASYSAVILPYLAWKHAYYGSFLPNTFYAKVYGLDTLFRLGKGLRYTCSFVFDSPAPVLLAVLLLVQVLRTDPEGIGRRPRYLLLMALASLCSVTAIGGDFMMNSRFYVPLVPILGLLMHELMLILARNGRWTAIRRTVFLAFPLTLLPVLFAAPRPQSASAVTAGVIAPYIRERWPRDSLVAVNVAGALPYLAGEYRYLDLLGITDAHISRKKAEDSALPIGHLKGDGNYLLMRRPDYILFAFPYGADVPAPIYPTEKELFGDPRFERQYRRKAVWIEVPPELRGRLAQIAGRHPQVRLLDGKMLFVYHHARETRP